MKKTLIVTAIVLCSAASAAVITWNIKAAYGVRVLTAYEAQSGCKVHMTIERESPPYRSNFKYTIPLRDPNDNDTLFVKKRIGFLGSRFMIAHEKMIRDANEAGQIATAIAGVSVPDVNDSGNFEE